jgi:predicted peptidase
MEPCKRASYRNLLILAVLAMAVGCQGPNAAVNAAFESQEVMDGGKTLLRYRILRPATIEPGRVYPLIVFLHGAGERGDDNVRQLTHGAAELLRYTEAHPAFVIFPQCPTGTWWDGPNWLSNDRKPAKVAAPLPQVIDLVDRMMQEQPIDPTRVYVTGMSMGGFGTCATVAARPDLFAAAMPVCGGGNPEWAARYRSTAFWFTHGNADPWVPVEKSRQMVRAMREAGQVVRYTELSGVGHDAWTPTYNSDLTLNWLFSQRRAPSVTVAMRADAR